MSFLFETKAPTEAATKLSEGRSSCTRALLLPCKGSYPYSSYLGHTAKYATVSKKMTVADGLRGLGITFITVGLLALAFMCFSGIQL